MNIKQPLILILLFVLAFLPRLYRIDNPVADWHSWRQTDTAAVSRNFIKDSFNPLFPKFDSYYDLNQVAADNPERYFFAEFPIYNILTYIPYKLFGVNEMYARLISVLLSSLATVFLYLLVKRYSPTRVALIAAIIFAILPYNVYYGRVIMPDPLHIMFTILALLLVTIWTKRKSAKIAWITNYLLPIAAGLATTGMLLTKPYGLVIGLPIAYLIIRKWRIKTFKKPSVYIYAFTAMIPFILWRWHIHLHPEGMFGTDWLYNAGNIRFTGAFFRWLIFDRMNRQIFATGGFVLFFFGLARGRSKKEGWFYYIWLLSITIFFAVIAKGNVTHDYYQLPLVPIGAIFMALGFELLVMFGNGLKTRIINFLLAITLFILMLAFGWYENRGLFNINHWEIVHAGKMADMILPKDAKVIAPYQSDSAFLYQTNRYGWTVGEGHIQEFIDKGATHLISVNYDAETNYWKDRCQVEFANPEFIIINLTICQPINPLDPATKPQVDLPGEFNPDTDSYL